MRPDLGVARDLGQILDEAFALLRGHGRVLLGLSAAIVVPVNLVVSGIGMGELTDGYEAGGNGLDSSQLAALLGTLLIVVPLVTATHVRVVLAAAAGAPVSAGSALSRALDDFAGLLLAYVLFAAGVTVGLVALIVPGVVVGVLWSLTAQAVVVDGRRGSDALRRSGELVSGRWWWVAGTLFVTNLVAVLLSLVFTIPAEALADAADSQAIALLGTTVAQVFTFSLTALTATLLYFSLRVRRGEPLPAGASAQPAALTGGFEPPVAGAG